MQVMQRKLHPCLPEDWIYFKCISPLLQLLAECKEALTPFPPDRFFIEPATVSDGLASNDLC